VGCASRSENILQPTTATAPSNTAAVAALQGQLGRASAVTKLHICEGLFRCAEALAAEGKRDEAVAIYDKLRGLQAPHQVRAGALRGAILTRGTAGLDLLREHLGSGDYNLFSAAVQTAQEMEGGAVTGTLAAALDGVPADNKILIMQTLGLRGDADALPALYTTAKSGPDAVRIAAIEAIAEVDDVSAVPVLAGLLGDSSRAVGDAAQEGLGSLTGAAADAAVASAVKAAEEAEAAEGSEQAGGAREVAVSALQAVEAALEEAKAALKAGRAEAIAEAKARAAAESQALDAARHAAFEAATAARTAASAGDEARRLMNSVESLLNRRKLDFNKKVDIGNPSDEEIRQLQELGYL